MSDDSALHGLSCPRCGGMVPIPEGQAIVTCPFCSLRSVVRGERGVRRYQVPCRIDAAKARQVYQDFLKSSWAIALSARSQAKVTETFLVHLPFWGAWGRGLGWIFGQEAVRSNKQTHYRPRERKVVQELSWNGAACEVGEFGVNQVSLEGRPLQPFDPEALHRTGMVFEPVGSQQEALEAARLSFEERIKSKGKLDRTSQVFVRIVRPRLGLIYYPLWVVRYLYRGRSFQVVVDGFSGEVLYGKAPGNVLYRAALLVGGMGLGAFLAIDVPYFLLTNLSGDDGDASFAILAGAFIAGVGLMFAGYQTFRHGEHYEFQKFKNAAGVLGVSPDAIREIGKAVSIMRNLQ